MTIAEASFLLSIVIYIFIGIIPIYKGCCSLANKLTVISTYISTYISTHIYILLFLLWCVIIIVHILRWYSIMEIVLIVVNMLWKCWCGMFPLYDWWWRICQLVFVHWRCLINWGQLDRRVSLFVHRGYIIGVIVVVLMG